MINNNEKINTYLMEEYDVVVVGAGHAGCEAALAASRMGKKTLLLSTTLEAVAMLACNPSIGGTGKGQLVREIDALGGEMGINIDKTFIQSKMLNRAKGPAVHSPRAQADKQRYHEEMKHTLELQQNLDLKQNEVVDLDIKENKIIGVITKTGAYYPAKTVILATGTFLNGTIHVASSSFSSGPNGYAPSIELADKMIEKGLPLRKFKTGTPARVLAHSLDYSKMQEQKGDEEITPFSFMNEKLSGNQVSCWLTYTNPDTHKLVADNIDKTAPYGGYTTGIGPRYCLSIEDKVSRFPERERHQLFIEPEGRNTEEIYVQGMSTSLPEDIQIQFYRSIKGLENVKISRFAYSIEYDCIDPMTLNLNLEHRKIQNLFCAGQLNGSSGYEEAAAQGLMAGINAVLKIDGKEPFILDRSDAYIGVLIDDLVTKGTNEPYRMMTSRAEYRLILRQDNADIRLTEKGYELGLATEERYNKYKENKEKTEKEIERLKNTYIDEKNANSFLKELGSSPVKNKVSLAKLMQRPEVTYDNLVNIDKDRVDTGKYVKEQAEIQLKYEGYIEKQLAQIERFKKLEGKRLPFDIDYSNLDGLRLEARQKLNDHMPESIGQASRISGVSPADINVLLIHLERIKGKNEKA